MKLFAAGISRPEAETLFQQDLESRAAQYVRQLVAVPLTQSQFDALVSVTFNSGKGGLTDLLGRSGLNAGHYQAVGAILRAGNFRVTGKVVDKHGIVHHPVLKGLVDRRKQEADIWELGVYPLHN
jgi:lysozyme